jgi:hypothetical protein
MLSTLYSLRWAAANLNVAAMSVAANCACGEVAVASTATAGVAGKEVHTSFSSDNRSTTKTSSAVTLTDTTTAIAPTHHPCSLLLLLLLLQHTPHAKRQQSQLHTFTITAPSWRTFRDRSNSSDCTMLLAGSTLSLAFTSSSKPLSVNLLITTSTEPGTTGCVIVATAAALLRVAARAVTRDLNPNGELDLRSDGLGVAGIGGALGLLGKLSSSPLVSSMLLVAAGPVPMLLLLLLLAGGSIIDLTSSWTSRSWPSWA